jgi:hypothetical protein
LFTIIHSLGHIQYRIALLSGLRCWVYILFPCGMRGKGRVRIRNRPHFFSFLL